MEQVEGYTPFSRTYIARKVVFPGGHRETLLRCVDKYRVPGGEAAAMADRPFVGKREALDADGRAELNRSKACARARRQLRWAVQSIQADRILTCTYRENMTDRRRALAHWNYFRALVMARYPGWVFVAVIEHQERGAIHFHAAVRGFQDVGYLRSMWLRVVGVDNGNIDIAYRKERFSDSGAGGRIASYMAKYIGKDFDSTPKGARRFFGSKERPEPVITRWWIQAKTDLEAFEVAYRATAGGRAMGVKQWVSGDGLFYWIASPDPGDVVPF